MEAVYPARPPTRRPPLGDNTRRANNASNEAAAHKRESYTQEQYEALERLYKSDGRNQYYQEGVRMPNPNYYPPPPANYKPAQTPSPAPTKQRVPPPKPEASQPVQESTPKTTRESKRKTHIGPWNLGRDLGKGATSRVRLARHAVTGQLVAVKIVPKRMARLTQAGSLASLDIREADLKVPPNTSHLPYSIEREVAIMKLIQHPHILQLVDIWENHNEIYLVLEYVDGGELFHFIGERGRLVEEVAIKLFRQMLSAVGYCHKLRICHRDLKPENILLTRDENVKIADFGMAALHQTSDHKLRTSCGSPHYAAPEIMQGIRYRGDRADIWSMGVILYACLVGGLPFDARGTESKEVTRELARLVIRGEYFMPPQLSMPAQDLIRRILRVNPNDRISINQMWRHPLLRQYDYLDDLNPISSNPQSLDLKTPDSTVIEREDIDDDILRHLKSMWHSFTEEQIIQQLISPHGNDQKMFYQLLVKYRESQLENYGKNVSSSPSDYHHIRPLKHVKKLTTRQFPRPPGKGPTRSGSRFTVISNAAETVKSYDPYNAYRPQHLTTQAEYANITIYRDNPPAPDNGNTRNASTNDSGNMLNGASGTPVLASGSHRFLAARGYVTKSSMSSTRSRGAASIVKPNIGHKRPVNFSYIRHSSARSKESSNSRLRQLASEGEAGCRESYISGRSERAPSKLNQSLLSASPPKNTESHEDPTSGLWKEVLQISTSLAKDCDAAFNSVASRLDEISVSDASSQAPWNKRPLPATPAQSESVYMELSRARRDAKARQGSASVESSNHIHRMVSHIDRLIRPGVDGQDRRIVSAPATSQASDVPRGLKLPAISEASATPQSNRYLKKASATDRSSYPREDRVGSAPLPQTQWHSGYSHDEQNIRTTEWTKDVATIRVVSESPSPIKAPLPLNIRKKPSRVVSDTPSVMSGGLGQLPKPYEYRKVSDVSALSAEQPEDPFGPRTVNQISNSKKMSWTKYGVQIGDVEYTDYDAVEDAAVPATRKKGFGLTHFFRKTFSKNEARPGAFGIYEDDESNHSTISDDYSMTNKKRNSWNFKQAEPRQNWLARLFRIKPATKHICFAVAKRRARQEIASVLRQWRKYGIESIVVDKQRNMVFAKVSAKNMAGIKPVAFAIEIMTVIEHGKKRQPLSIARFTQEGGAASSFQRVVDQLAAVLKTRGMLVSDERKASMMIQTLNG